MSTSETRRLRRTLSAIRPRSCRRCRDRMYRWRHKANARAVVRAARRPVMRDDEVQRLISVVDPRIKRVVISMAMMGLRQGEVGKLDPEHRDRHSELSRAAQAVAFRRLAKAAGHGSLRLYDLRRYWLNRQRRPPR